MTEPEPITRRDLFAAFAMHKLLEAKYNNGKLSLNIMPEAAWDLADKMIEVGDAKPKNG